MSGCLKWNVVDPCPPYDFPGYMAKAKQPAEIPVSTMRHSAAHVLAQALREKFPKVDLAIGPDTDHGFFYDVMVDALAITGDEGRGSLR